MSASLFAALAALRPLRPHQARALEALRGSLAAGKRRPLLMAPTGFGKTLTAAHIVQRALGKGKRVAFTVPALSLIDQTVAAFEAEGLDAVGVMQGAHPRTDRDQPVQVCSVQTLARRRRPEVDLVLVDEAHQLHKEIFRWMADEPGVPFVGLTATPWTRGLGRHYDDLIIAASIGDLIRDGYLADFVAYAPSVPDLSGVRTVAGEFHQDDLGERVDQPKIVGDVVDTWMRLGENRPTLCYGVNRAHAQHIEQRFVEAGVATAYIDAFTERPDRELIFRKLRQGEARVICNIGTLTTGVDLPMVSCIIDAKPTKSEMLFVQTIGRGLRTHPGKDRLVILDHAGNHLRLGRVTDIHHESLDDGEPRAKADKAEEERAEPLPRLCDDCMAVLPRAARVCQECGCVKEAKSNVQHEEGDLVELGSGRKISSPPPDKVIFLAELRWHARDRGYADGWVSHKFREKFGEWPPYPIKFADFVEPSLRTRQWLRSRQIAFAKARRASG